MEDASELAERACVAVVADDSGDRELQAVPETIQPECAIRLASGKKSTRMLQ